MTAVGKILIFFVLLLSVATSALMVFAHQARTNWKLSAQKNASIAQISEAAYKSESKKRSEEQKLAEERNASLQKEVLDARATVKDQARQIDDHKRVVTEKDTASQSSLDSQKLAGEELARLKTEREDFNKKYNVLQESITTLTTKNADLEKAAAVVGNKLVDAERRREGVTVELQRTTAELAAARAGNLAPASNGRPAAVPAPANVRGEVTYGGTTGLVSITVGADNNLQVGNELFVARTKPTPMYLGTIKLTRVNPKESVGQFIPAGRNDKIQKGDEVYSSLSGK